MPHVTTVHHILWNERDLDNDETEALAKARATKVVIHDSYAGAVAIALHANREAAKARDAAEIAWEDAELEVLMTRRYGCQEEEYAAAAAAKVAYYDAWAAALVDCNGGLYQDASDREFASASDREFASASDQHSNRITDQTDDYKLSLESANVAYYDARKTYINTDKTWNDMYQATETAADQDAVNDFQIFVYNAQTAVNKAARNAYYIANGYADYKAKYIAHYAYDIASYAANLDAATADDADDADDSDDADYADDADDNYVNQVIALHDAVFRVNDIYRNMSYRMCTYVIAASAA